MMSLKIAKARVEIITREVDFAKLLSDLIGKQIESGQYSLADQKIRVALSNILTENSRHLQEVENAIGTLKKTPNRSRLKALVEQRFASGLENIETAKLIFTSQYADEVRNLDKTDRLQLDELFSELTSAWKGEKDNEFVDHQKQKVDFKKLLKAFSENRKGLPSLFISYSWGIAANVKRVHQIAKHLKLAGFDVILDIWHNKTGCVPSFIERINSNAQVDGRPFRADYVLLCCTKDLNEKWNNRVTSGANREDFKEKNYIGHVVGEELAAIYDRYRVEPNTNKTIFPLIISGVHKDVVPTFFRTVATADLDFNNMEEYFFKILNLLSNLLPKEEKSIKAMRKFLEAQQQNDEKAMAELMSIISQPEEAENSELLSQNPVLLSMEKLDQGKSEAFFFVKQKFSQLPDDLVQHFCQYFADDFDLVEQAVNKNGFLISQLIYDNFSESTLETLYASLLKDRNPVSQSYGVLSGLLSNSSGIETVMKLALWELFSTVSTELIPEELLNNFAVYVNHNRNSSEPSNSTVLKVALNRACEWFKDRKLIHYSMHQGSSISKFQIKSHFLARAMRVYSSAFLLEDKSFEQFSILDVAHFINDELLPNYSVKLETDNLVYSQRLVPHVEMLINQLATLQYNNNNITRIKAKQLHVNLLIKLADYYYHQDHCHLYKAAQYLNDASILSYNVKLNKYSKLNLERLRKSIVYETERKHLTMLIKDSDLGSLSRDKKFQAFINQIINEIPDLTIEMWNSCNFRSQEMVEDLLKVAFNHVRGLYAASDYQLAQEISNKILLKKTLFATYSPSERNYSWYEFMHIAFLPKYMVKLGYPSAEIIQVAMKQKVAAEMLFNEDKGQRYTHNFAVAEAHTYEGNYTKALAALQELKNEYLMPFKNAEYSEMIQLSYYKELMSCYLNMGDYSRVELQYEEAKAYHDKYFINSEKATPYIHYFLIDLYYAQSQYCQGRLDVAQSALRRVKEYVDGPIDKADKLERTAILLLEGQLLLHKDAQHNLSFNDIIKTYHLKALSLLKSVFGENSTHLAFLNAKLIITEACCNYFL